MFKPDPNSSSFYPVMYTKVEHFNTNPAHTLRVELTGVSIDFQFNSRTVINELVAQARYGQFFDEMEDEAMINNVINDVAEFKMNDEQTAWIRKTDTHLFIFALAQEPWIPA